MNPLESHPRARRIVYTVLWVIGLALTAFQVGYASVEISQPSWLVIAWPVFGVVASGVGYTAARNTAVT